MEDSSPDLSLRLRRGSSGSRDSYYIEFTRGIDSDIEIEETIVPKPTNNVNDEGPKPIETTNQDDSPSNETSEKSLNNLAPTLPPVPSDLEDSMIMEDLQKCMRVLPSPSSKDPLATVESLSPERRSNTSNLHVTICDTKINILTDEIESSKESSPPPPFHSSGTSPNTIITGTQSSTVAVFTKLQPCLSPTRRPMRLLPDSRIDDDENPNAQISAGSALATTISALYGKLLVVLGFTFPVAEVISTYIPPSFYEVYYLYLYVGSMMFLFFMYVSLMWGNGSKGIVSPAMSSPRQKPKPAKQKANKSSDSGDESDQESDIPVSPRVIAARRPSIIAASLKTQHYGSFYLRMGAVAFGIGSMIYSGLEFGQYFELESTSKCSNILVAVTPLTRMLFIFIQMYFIFLNNEQINVYCYRGYRVIARFGLQHMIGTNLSVWFSVLVQETKHTILTFYNPENQTLRISHRLGNKAVFLPMATTAHLRMPRGLKGPHNIFECRRTNIIGTLVQDASPFLFPCTIEYSLICAAILYVMWRNVCRPIPEPRIKIESLTQCKRSPHHYSVDCARAHKGLFLGILMLVMTIISLILFFVLISRPDFVSLAVTEVNICELVLYVLTTLATIVGMWQIRNLEYDFSRNFTLDDILLVGAQSGSFLYSTFTIISGHFTLKKETILVLITALVSLIETGCQTMFILNAGRRSARTPDQIRKKPGREIVTFLLVSNLAMWAINTLEKTRAESHPIQLNFYGLWAWSILTHVAMPLAIFYRFHSTVCLCEIWKRAYKIKPTYM